MLNEGEVRAILTLIARANINGSEALAVAQLQQKLNSMLPVVSSEKPKEDKKQK